jgi:hypothetical protein
MTSSMRVSLGTSARSMSSTRQAPNVRAITASSMSLRSPAVRRLALSSSLPPGRPHPGARSRAACLPARRPKNDPSPSWAPET